MRSPRTGFRVPGASVPAKIFPRFGFGRAVTQYKRQRHDGNSSGQAHLAYGFVKILLKVG